MIGSVAEGEAPDVSTIQATEFGMTFINSAELPSSSTRVQRGISTGAKLDRFPLYWDRVEPSSGGLNWSGQDAALRGNEEQGLGTLAILLNTSPLYWPDGRRMPVEMPRVGDGMRNLLAHGQQRGAECIVDGPPAPQGLYEPIFSDGNDNPAPGKSINSSNSWAQFVSLAVNRYRPGGTAGLNVRHWEIWNEPDLCHFWSGTSQEYARLLKVAYLVIKQFDSQATVIWGGLALYGPKYENGADFLNELLTAIKNDPLAAAHNGYSDAAAIHQYSNVFNSYYFTRYVQSALASTPWPNKPIWVTESGVPVCDTFPGPDCPSPYRGNAEEQASYIWQNIAHTRLANNNAPIFHFQLHDDGGNECRTEPPADGFGLFTNEPDAHCVPHSAVARPAYTAFQLASQYLSHVELVSDEIQDGDIRKVTFYHPESQQRRVLVWSLYGRNGVANLSATSNSALRLSPDGSQETITPVNGVYHIPVSAAVARNSPLEATYPIGGKTYLIIEGDLQAPTISMNPLPLVSPPVFPVSWSASDSGSGIESVTILYQRGDEQVWKTWQANLPATGSVIFRGDVGQPYRFAVQAIDHAGNRNEKLRLLASTLVNDGSPTAQVTGRVRDIKGNPAPWALVSVGQAGVFADETGHFTATVPIGEQDLRVQQQIQRHGQLFYQDSTLSLLSPPNNNPVRNGDFEQPSFVGVTNWDIGGSSTYYIEPQPLSQDHAFRLARIFVPNPSLPGDNGPGGNSTLSQKLTVPTGNPFLALLYKVESAETDGGNGSCDDSSIIHDKFEITIEQNTQSEQIHCQEVGSEWQHGFFDLSTYAGKEITLTFSLYESSPNRHTSAIIDLIMIGESPELIEPKSTYLPLIPHQSRALRPWTMYLPLTGKR